MGLANDVDGQVSERIHLVVLLHGLYGSPSNLAVPAEEIVHASSSSRLPVHVFLPAGYEGAHTWDGIDVNARRVARELDDEIARLEGEDKDVTAISIMGYSLGGLIARYLLGILAAREEHFFEKHRPVSFSTFASPWIGVLKYGSKINTVVHSIGRRVFSRTGQQIYLFDKDHDDRHLLSILADPNMIFMQALAAFPRIQVVANGIGDRTVPYPTASFSLHDPYADYLQNGVIVETDDDHVITSYRLPGQPAPEPDFGSDEEAVDALLLEKPKKSQPETHWIPPIFILPYRAPWKYAPLLIAPIWMAIMLCIARVGIMWLFYTAFQSRRRLARGLLHPSSYPPLLVPPLSLASTTFTRAPRNIEDDTPTSSRPSRDGTPPFESLPSDPEHPPSRVPLLLTDEQKTIVRNLTTYLPQVEKVITWFPWAFNSHATIVVRSGKRFPYQEEARGVVKRWARWVVESEEVVNVQ